MRGLHRARTIILTIHNTLLNAKCPCTTQNQCKWFYAKLELLFFLLSDGKTMHSLWETACTMNFEYGWALLVHWNMKKTATTIFISVELIKINNKCELIDSLWRFSTFPNAHTKWEKKCKAIPYTQCDGIRLCHHIECSFSAFVFASRLRSFCIFSSFIEFHFIINDILLLIHTKTTAPHLEYHFVI